MVHKLIAKAVVVNDAGEILCLTRSLRDDARAGEWDFPGGKLDPGESHVAAVIREVQEEAGLTIYDPQFVYATTDAYGDDLILTFFFFVAHVTGSIDVRLSEEHEAFEWATLDVLRAKPDFPAFHHALDFIAKHNLL